MHDYVSALLQLHPQQLEQELLVSSRQCGSKLIELEAIVSKENQETLGGFKSKGVNPIIVHDFTSEDPSKIVSQVDGVYNCLKRFEPRVFARPKPSEMALEEEPIDSGFFWIQDDISSHFDILWDITMEEEEQQLQPQEQGNEAPFSKYEHEELGVVDEMKQFEEQFARAFQKQLLPTQQKFIITFLKQKPKTIANNPNLITPNRFTNLINHNPEIAAQVLTVLMNTPIITEYDFK